MGIRLVHADDDADLRILMAETFGADGRVTLVGSATNGDEAIALTAEHQPEVVLLDIDMPGRTGMDVLPLVREAAPAAKVIVLSGYSRHEMAERAIAGGAVGYLEKGLSPRRLVEDVVAMSGALGAVDEAIAGARIAAGPSGTRLARAFVHHALADIADADVLDTVKLLVNELVTNSILHARSATEVTVFLAGPVLRVEVVDDDPQLPTPRVAAPGDESGRGMLLVDALSSRWGSEPRGSGKVVWFEVPRPAPISAETLGPHARPRT